MDPAAAKIIADAIIQVSEPSWPLIISVITSCILALIAGFALWYASRQLGTMSKQADAAQAQTEAAVIQVQAAKELEKHAIADLWLTIDQIYEGPGTQESRVGLFLLRHEIETTIKETQRHLTVEQRKEEVKKELAEHIHNVLENEPREYLELTRIASFYEMLGWLEKRGHISLDEIYEVHRGGIDKAYDAFENLINKIEESGDYAPGYLEYFGDLATRIRIMMKERGAKS